MFRDEKITHMAAYLIRALGGRASHIQLLKLMYLADRQSFDDRGHSISGDRFVAMEQGPVLSNAYNFMKGEMSTQSVWDNVIQNIDGTYYHSLRNDDVDLDLISPYEERVLSEVVAKHKDKSPKQLVKFLHDNCPEWKDPGKTSKPIGIEKILVALEYDEETALCCKRRASARTVLDRRLSRV